MTHTTTNLANSARAKLHQLPPELITSADYARMACEFIDLPALEYIRGGSGKELTLARNSSAFDAFEIYPRLVRDCTQGHTRSTLLGQEFRHPILLAPVAAQKLVHPEGELASARAAKLLEAGFVCSTLASTPLEAIARELSKNTWFQLYLQPKREHSVQLIQRAQAAGYSAIVLTLDAPIQPLSLRAQRAGFELPHAAAPINLQKNNTKAQVSLSQDDSIIFQGMMREAPKLADIAWLQTQTALPIIVKGVLHPEDAVQLKTMGVAAIVVSNHGGRSLDGAPASINALPAIRAALGNQFPILLDGGIGTGSDIFKAIALGANAVLIGRPYIYALAVAGTLGVAHLIKLLRDELEVCMALAGCPTLADITSAAIFQRP
jgi:4-hydroxymandelate oxidase